MNPWSRLGTLIVDEPVTGLAVVASALALAITPVAFAVMSRSKYFDARRGRVMRRPEWYSVVLSMLLVMGIPAILLAMVAKSRSYDHDRYEFDPNRTWSVAEQGRGYATVAELDAAVKAEMGRLTAERKGLVNAVKKLDESMLPLRASASASPPAAQAMAGVLDRLADIRLAVGVDAPQQLIDDTAPPVDLPAATAVAIAPAAGPTPTPIAPDVATPTPPPAAGLSPAQRETELAAVPAPQKPLAAMIPLTDLPAGWVVGKSGERSLETFNAENLYEKIDGRAESFVQYDVRGMAYTYYHPAGDDSAEVQLYIFEMGSPLKALGKFGSERPEGVEALTIGSEGYASAGSTLFYADRYYTQIVSTRDDPKFAAFALDLAKRIAAIQLPDSAKPAPDPAVAAAGAPAKPVTPEELFTLLPTEPGRGRPQFVAQDVFGYSFLSDVFLADYQEGDATWQGFLRPFATPEEAAAAFDKYLEEVKAIDAEVKILETDAADRLAVVSNFGLVDAVFVKGNALAGANGAPAAEPAEKFARAFARGLPAVVPYLGGGDPKDPSAPPADDAENK